MHTPLTSTLVRTFVTSLFLTGLLMPGLAQEQGPERWEEAIQKFEKQDSLHPVSPGSNLFVGSSSIAIWQDIANYFPDHQVLNRGFGGSQFSDLLYYVDRVVYPYKPAKIFIYEGDNDLAAGDTPQQIMKEAKKLRKMIKKELGNTPVVFISPKPSMARWDMKDQYEALNKMLKEYTEKTEDTQYADVWTPALDEDGVVFNHIFKGDSLHMNGEGYKIWQKSLEPYLE